MSHPKRPRDPNQLAKSIIDIATGQKPDRDPTPEEQGKRPVAVESGSRGGKVRAKLLSPQKRQEIARKAAKLLRRYQADSQLAAWRSRYGRCSGVHP